MISRKNLATMRQQPQARSSSSELVKEFAMAHLPEAFIIPSMVHFHICLESNDCMFYIVLILNFWPLLKILVKMYSENIFLLHGKRGGVITQLSNLTARTVMLTSDTI
jgi:hypothetical protein